MALTRIKTNNILDKQVFENDLADGAVTFDKIQITTGGATGEVLKVGPGGTLIWEVATGTSQALDTLIDVDTTGKLNGDSLVYNSGTSQWEPGSNVPSSLGLNALIDVTFTFPLVQNEFLRYDGAGWVNDPVSIIYVEGVQPVAVTGLLDNLVDVVVPSPTINQHLVFDGSVWRASDAANVGSIDQLDDVDTTTVTPISGDALVWDGVADWVPFAIAGLGASSNTFVVADITARDLLTPQEGDSAFVRIGSSGEYEQYVYDSAWILLATQDSARTDANTAEAIVSWNTGSPVLIGNVSQNSRVTTVTVEVSIAFNDATAVLTVGDAGDNSRLLTNDMIDLTEVGTYVCNVDYIYASAVDTDILTYFNFGTSTQGTARVIVTHV